MTSDLAPLYDPRRLESDAHAVVSLLAQHLGAAQTGAPPVSPAIDPDDAARRWSLSDDRQTLGQPLEGTELDALTQRVLADSAALYEPGWVGHQVAPPLPTAVLGDLIAGYLNNGMAIYDVGPAAAGIERAVIRWMADRLGLPERADGVLTSGGTLANLTALLAARQVASEGSYWREGACAGPPMTVLASAHAHYSIDRAARVMGWGEQGVTPVATDESLRIRPEALDEALALARKRGRRVVAVVASSCNTPAGTFDPLEPIAAFCAREGLWLHADGAHGAAAALSPRYAYLVKGIERSDSIVWDAHKLLLTPATTSAVIYREGDRGYDAFPQDASYLWEGAGKREWHEIGRRTFECTKRMSALRVYLPLALHGEGIFRAYVERQFDLARDFAALLEEAPDYALFAKPEANIVCFRFEPGDGPSDPAAGDALQDAIRSAINRAGEFYLTRTRLPSGVHLRTTLMNPLTTLDDLARLLDAVRAAAKALR